MFLEPQSRGHRGGWIEVITGSMFSGKTEELIRRLRRTQFANQNLIIYKPKQDVRYSKNEVVSHDANSLESIAVDSSADILNVPRDIHVVGIDEAQFFDMDLPRVCEKLSLSGIRVIIAGLDMDFMGRPFGPIPELMAIAEYVTKVHAICPHCGNLATHSYRLSDETATVVLGEKDKYEPRCRVCYSMGKALDFRAQNGKTNKTKNNEKKS